MKPYYQHGGITIYHGDCREILPKIEEKSIDMIFTDPPYGHNNNNGDLIHRFELAIPTRAKKGQVSILQESRPIANDGPEANALVRWFFGESKRLLKPGGCCCCCCGGGGGPDPQFARWSLWIDEFLDFKQMIVWDKGPIGMGWHYRRSYEVVLVAQQRGAACKWYDTTDKIENIIRPGYLGIKKIIPLENDHPTPKPPELASHFMLLHSLPGDVVLDPFMGGGSTPLAAKNHGRRFIGIEIDEKFCEMAAKRLSQEVFDFS